MAIPAAFELPTAFKEKRYIRIGSSKCNIKDYPKREIELFKILDGRTETIETIPAKYQELTFHKLFGYYGSVNSNTGRSRNDGTLKNRVDFSGEVGYNNETGKRRAWLLEIKEADMLKLEIKMDEKKIVADRKYQVESIYQALEQAFARYRLNKTEESDGTLCFVGNGNPKDYGAFGCIITSLKEKAWFMDYVIKWIWYNSDDGETEDDFTVEDVLYHYTKKLSVA